MSLDHEYQQMAANAICHAANLAQISWQEAACAAMAPSAIYRPRLSVDGNQWCALYGDNLQDGVAGFGESPADAMYDFDTNWRKSIRSKP
jgi:hypothetical protein